MSEKYIYNRNYNLYKVYKFNTCVEIPAYYNINMIYRLLMSSEELRLFDKIRVFLDEDFSSAEHFTVSIKYLSLNIYTFNDIDVLICIFL